MEFSTNTHGIKYPVKFIIAALTVLLALSGCGGGSSGGGTGGNNSDDDDSPPPTTGLDSRPQNTTCLAPANADDSPQAQLQPAFPDLPVLNFPLGLFQAPGDSANFYTIRRNGRVIRFSNSAAADTLTTVLNISSRVDVLGSEGGLLGLAFHPQFASNNTLYLYYTSASPNRSVIARFTMQGDGLIDPDSEQVILELTQPAGNHNGGAIGFSPVDGYLYIGFGDGGGFSQRAEAQNTTNFYGAMLRIDVDPLTTSPPFYQIPPDNPFAGSSTNATEIFAWGLRNPFRWSFDSTSGVLWAGDVGEANREEIDIIENGGNYGWPLTEGFVCGPDNSGCNPADYHQPEFDYPRSDGQTISGGYVYRGTLVPGLNGAYIYGDYGSGNIWALEEGSNGYNNRLISNISSLGSVVAFGQDHSGEVYAVLAFAIAGNNFQRITAAGPAGTSNIPATLSASGCAIVSDPREPAAGLIPYAVIAPLWSDGTDKERFIALPDGEQITLDSDGDFIFPVGTVLMKHFIANGTYIETRLLMHHSSGWAGYSYEWNDAQTDALLLDDAKDIAVAGLQWHFPSGSECNQCHTLGKNFTLGPETAQLNHDLLYPTTGRTANQLDTLAAIGLFSNSITAGMRSAPLLALTDNDASLEQRAKSYLHSNCSQCHMPGGTGGGDMDLRFNTPLAAMNICSVAAVDDLAITGAQRVAPGNPALSILLERMQRVDEHRMPPLASGVVDTQATALISDWIAGLSSCP